MTEPTSHQYIGKDLEAMSFAENYHRWIISEMAAYVTGKVAEVGAGVGSVSSLLLNLGVKHLDAFEPSVDMYAKLQSNLNLVPQAAAINAFFGVGCAPASYDTVVYINVLEHIEDDAGELERARDALVAGGHLLIFVPALSWLYSNLDREVGHFRRYTKHNMVRLVEDAGLDVLKARYFDIAGVLPWYINFVLLKNSIGGGSVALYDKLVVPIMRPVERFLPLPIGKNVLLIAKKPAV
jgi:SAM-dependent methyltransferase